jgi:thymidylate synthase
VNITGKSINELVHKAADKIISEGATIESRAGTTKELIDQTIVLRNPRNRHLFLNGRSSNIYSSLAEVIWVLAGKEEINPFLSFFLKRAKDFSDDGGQTWSDAYGPRLYRQGALENVVKTFIREGKSTRRAVLSVYCPDLDTQEALELRGLPEKSAIPCNDFLIFWIRDNKLNLKLASRSGDLIWGTSNVNILEFTIIQEIILSELNRHPGFEDVVMGEYNQNILSFHVYNETIKQAEDILRFSQDSTVYNTEPLIGPPIRFNKDFFSSVYNYLCCNLTGALLTEKELDELFDIYSVPKGRNTLYQYCKLLSYYVKLNMDLKEELNPLTLSEDIAKCVLASRFTKPGLAKLIRASVANENTVLRA